MTTTDLVSGRITSFKREQGFGLITLDDGTPVKFDSGICTMLPEEGAAVRLRVGPAKWGGGLKALHVEPVEQGLIRRVAPARSLEDLLAAVQSEHLVSGLTEQILEQIVAQRFGGKPGAGTILGLLDGYYTGDPARARSDGYLRRDPGLPAVTDDVLGELAALMPDAKLPRQVRWTGRPAPTIPPDEADVGGGGPRLVVRDPDGRERSLEIAELDDVIELANAALRRTGDGRRVYKLDTGGGWQAYLAIASERASRLASTLPFATPPDDVM